MNQNSSRHVSLEDDTARLISRSGPPPAMPDEIRHRIHIALEALARPKPSIAALAGAAARRAAPWLAAAATVILIVVLGHDPDGLPGGVSWAQVAELVGETRSVSALLQTTAIDPDGSPRPTSHATVYFQDPGLSRHERWSDGDASSREIIITHRKPGRAEQLMLMPQWRVARRVSHVFRGVAEQNRPRVELAAESWRRLEAITSDVAKAIGTRSFNGRPADGFEAPLDALLPDPASSLANGFVRVWAERSTATPIRIELGFTDEWGAEIRTTLSDISWNVDLNEDLFRMEVPEGWTVERVEREVVELEAVRLAPGVALRVGPEDGQPLATEDDVVGVRGGESTTMPTSGEPRQVRLTFELAPAAMQRLRSFSADHPTRLLVATFDHRTRIVPVLAPAASNRMTLDLSRLDLSLEEIEHQFLVPRTKEAP